MLVSPARSLRVRLIVGVVVIEIVMLSLLVWSNLGVIRQAHGDRLRDTANSILEQITTTTGSYLVQVDYAALEEYLSNIAAHDELTYLVVLGRDQRPVVSFGKLPEDTWPDAESGPLAVQDGTLDVAGDIRIGGQLMGKVKLGFSLDLMEQSIEAAKLRSIIIAGTEIILTIIVTVFFGVRLTRRIGDLASAAQRVGAGDYHVEVKTGTPDEVGMTAQAFNRMVTEISRRTKRLQETLARERVIEETAIDGMITYDAQCRILSANPAMEALFGYSENTLIGHLATLLLEGGDQTTWTTVTGTRREAFGLRKDGSRFPLEWYVGKVDIGGELLFAATLHDITERKKTEQECMILLEGNRFLIHKSLAVQEEERRNLARELHDELGQCTTAIQADAEIIHELSYKKDNAIETSARAILDVSARIYDVVHSMMQRLRPSVLDDLGLLAALQDGIDAWRNRLPELDCQFTTAGDLSGLGEAVNITVYRIVQESLTNVAKHAEASKVTIHLSLENATEGEGPHLLLSISDNGRGTQLDMRGRGLGLIGMRERIEALSGCFTLKSAPGEGMSIEASIPITETGV
ncbi:diguanylate cyclase/phosphodiesterase (GGDEF & EAL domains) with PAS/PAC sensor(s) [hydrothermal vent metagenome]|uniref:Oxygen sensor histidine kinase NreB n=1 Tax=hydrothermal vent metagenome TaxID=652676 RepID=A0A3B0ZHZ2_9ZZZZ